MPKVYICSLKLCDYLTFSSTVGYANIMGVTYTVYKPQPYLHNYSLMYGFGGLLYASLGSPHVETTQIEYSLLDDVEKKLYIYPARPKKVHLRRMLMNIKGEGAVEVRQPKPKSMYPWHVAHLCFAPGSVFETVVIAKLDNIRIPSTIRVGVKRQGVFRVVCEEATVKGNTSGLTDPVNLGDLSRYGLAPDSYVVLLSTKTAKKGVPNSNIIVKAYYKENRVAVLETRSGIRFRVPLIGIRY
ncbi:MAG: type I-D CRISPR-associated protein Cas5/Csc1 [Sulfolobales archaeon]